ncbi:MAG: hypothetical protein ACI9ZM_001975 [Paracoccaceae bacterium]|jgi:hypothetical protein
MWQLRKAHPDAQPRTAKVPLSEKPAEQPRHAVLTAKLGHERVTVKFVNLNHHLTEVTLFSNCPLQT